MAKQTMATPHHAFVHRTDTKTYRLQNPQSPICRNELHEKFSMDDYPMGTNAVVAVISYTGYDMEDAMIVNKSSYERGFGHGSMYLCEMINRATPPASPWRLFSGGPFFRGTGWAGLGWVSHNVKPSPVGE